MRHLITLAFACISFSSTAQVIDTTVTGNAMHMNLNLTKLDSTISAMQELIESLQAPDLSGIERSDMSLLDANLPNASLAGAEIPFANLYGANLTNASLMYANLHGADLSNANLNGADLSNANLQNAYIFFADFTGANLQNVNFANASVGFCTWTGAYIEGCTGFTFCWDSNQDNYCD